MAIANNMAAHSDGISDFINDLRGRVRSGDDIPIADFEKYAFHVGAGGLAVLRDQWEEAKRGRKVLDLIAECTAAPGPDEGVMAMAHRTNRLLAAILAKLSES